MYEERRARKERRLERRYPVACKCVWRKSGESREVRAYMSDMSMAGVSFITSTRQRPSINEAIELVGLDQSTQFLRVARTTAYDRQNSLVACEASEGHLRLAALPRGTTVRTACRMVGW